MFARRIPRLAIALGAALTLVLAGCSDDDGGGGNGAGDSTTTGPTVPPRTDGPGRPAGDDALQATLLTKEEVNADEDPDAPTFFANELTYGVARPADEFTLCEQPSPLNEVEPAAEASVSFQDFLGGEIDQRVLRYESPEAAAAVFAAVQADFEMCERWRYIDPQDRAIQVNTQAVEIAPATEVDERLSFNIYLQHEGVSAINNFLLVRDGADLVRIRTAYSQGKQRLAGDWIDPVLEKLRALPA